MGARVKRRWCHLLSHHEFRSDRLLSLGVEMVKDGEDANLHMCDKVDFITHEQVCLFSVFCHLNSKKMISSNSYCRNLSRTAETSLFFHEFRSDRLVLLKFSMIKRHATAATAMVRLTSDDIGLIWCSAHTHTRLFRYSS